MRRIYLLLALVLFVFSACDKDRELSNQVNCDNLKNAISTGDVQAAKIEIEKLINTLPSKIYNEANINSIIDAIQDQCGFFSAYDCFDCVQTLPSMTEIIIGVRQNGLVISKIVDLSYDNDNKIVFINMH